MSTPLIALDDLKAQLPIREGNDEFDEKLAFIINAVSEQIEKFCRRQFAKQSYSEIFHVQAGATTEYDLYGGGYGSNSFHDGLLVKPSDLPFRLGMSPIADAASVRVFYDLSHRFEPETELAASEFTVLAEKGLVFVSKPLRKSRDSVKITYEAGYEADGEPANLSESLPADLKMAVITQCLHVWQKLDLSNVSVTDDRETGSTQRSRFSAQGGFLPDVQHLVAPYRRMLRGRG